jgi:hypothetical protein
MRFATSMLLAVSLLAFPALAAEKINFTVPITDADDQVITECDDQTQPKPECKTRIPVTLGMVVMRALVVPEQNMSPEESLKRGQLALKLYKAQAVEVSPEDAALIRKQVAKAWGPLITAKVFPMLGPVETK